MEDILSEEEEQQQEQEEQEQQDEDKEEEKEEEEGWFVYYKKNLTISNYRQKHIICLLIFSMHCSAFPRTLEFIWSFSIGSKSHVLESDILKFSVNCVLLDVLTTTRFTGVRLIFTLFDRNRDSLTAQVSSLHWKDVCCFLTICPQDSYFQMLANVNVVKKSSLACL